MTSRTKRRQTCGSFDVPDLPKILSTLNLEQSSSPTMSEGRSSVSPLPQTVEDEEGADGEESPTTTAKGATGSGRTRLSRASKTDGALRMNRRVSMKPQRKGGLQVRMPNSSTEEDIKKFYLNNRLGSAASRQNALETIFEEPAVVRNELRLIGLKKLKRSMACKNGYAVSKQTIQSRRKKVKSLFGGSSSGKKFNKLSMDAFLMHLKSLSEDEGDDGVGAGSSASCSTTSV